jgi:uncharacterized protein YkwD
MRHLSSPVLKPAFLITGLAAAALTLAACSGFGGPAPTTALSAGLSARMDQPGARLDTAEAIGIINAYRSSVGTSAVSNDPALQATAQSLADQYASSGTSPRTPDGVVAIRSSAGYATFADTFSGWRNSSNDAQALTSGAATRAGVAMAFNPSSAYGIHWVLVLDD